MPYVPGYNTGNIFADSLAPELAKKSFAASYMRLMPGGAAKLAGILGMMKTKTAVQPEHFYYTKSMVFPRFVVTAAAAAAATTLTVDSTQDLLPGMVFLNFRTNEVILVVSVTPTTSINVARGYGTTAAAAINATDVFYQVGTAFEEASARPVAANINPVRVPNLTQIFRNSWALSDTARATEVIAGNGNVAESKMDCMEFHMTDMESALLFGERYSGTLANKPFRKMDGILNSIKSYAPANVQTAGATTNYTQLEALLDPVFNVQTDPKLGPERVLFVGGQALRVITAIGRSNAQYHIVNGESSFGLRFSEFNISRGKFRMIEHPLLNSNPDWAKMAFALDLSSMSLAYLQGRNTKQESYGEGGKYVENGIDAVGGSLTTECTLEFMNPAANAVLYNLTAAAVG